MKAIRIKRWMNFTGYASVFVGLLAGPLIIAGANAWLIFSSSLVFCLANIFFASLQRLPQR